MLQDPDLLAAEILRASLPDAVVETQITPKSLNSSRYVWVHSVGGLTIDAEHLDAPSVEVVAYSNSRAAASTLAREAQRALHDAWANGTVTSNGHIARFSTSLRPTEQRVDGQPAEVYRFTALFELVTRPNNS